MDVLNQLVDALRCLPGIGPKTAQRMVYYLLKHQRQRGLRLAACMQEAMQVIKQCIRCNNYTEHNLCALCQDISRDFSTLCIVESPTDLLAIEQSNVFKGTYFVLMGKISPLDGLGPEDIGLPRLYELVIAEQTKEVILALNSSIEGQTTAHFIRELFVNHTINISQLAQGIPFSGDLAFLDSYTISSAIRNRHSVEL